MNNERKIRDVKKFRLIDDAFFEVVASNKDVCQEILRTIMEDTALVVEEVIPQSSKKNLYGRSVRLDALCILSNGVRCNIEVQRADNDDHLRRARFNAAMITAKDSEAGMRFREIAEVYIIYISESDFFGKGKTIYHMDKILRETGETVDDGEHEIFVNCEVKDNSDISELMSCFMQEKVNNPKFPAISKTVGELKETEGGLKAMCQITEKYYKEGKAKGRAEGRIKERIKAIQKMIEKDCSKEFVLSLGYTEEEYKKASS